MMFAAVRKSGRRNDTDLEQDGAGGALARPLNSYTFLAIIARTFNLASCGAFGALARALTDSSTGGSGLQPASESLRRMESNGATQSIRESSSVMQRNLVVAEAKLQTLQGEVKKFENQALECKRRKDVVGARGAMRRRKDVQGRIRTLEGQIANMRVVDDGLDDIHFARNTADAMLNGVATMRQAAAGMSVDEISDVMGDTGEIMNDVKEVQDALAKPIGEDTAVPVDEDDLDKELEQLEQSQEPLEEAPSRLAEAAAVANAGITNTTRFPLAPGHSPVAAGSAPAVAKTTPISVKSTAGGGGVGGLKALLND